MRLKRAVSDTLENLAPKLWLDLNILRRNPNFGPEYWLVSEFCRKNAIAVDVGGNRGMFAYYMARLSSEVHVFEPNAICLEQLKKIKTRNMNIHPVALSDRNGEATIRFDPRNTGIGTIESSNRLSNNPGIRDIVEARVQVRTLDSFRMTGVGFVKVDVEGHEPAVLRGAREFLKVNRPILLMELELRHNPRAFEETWGALADLGYVARACTRAGLKPIDRSDVPALQQGIPETNPGYVNNFVFAPIGRL